MPEPFNLKHGLFADVDTKYPLIGRKNEWKSIEYFINNQSHGSRTFLIIGDYGSGKTFMLDKIREAFKNNKFAVAKKSLVIDMRLVESEPESKIARSIITNAFDNIGYARIFSIVNQVHNLDERLLDTNFQKIIRGIQNKNRTAYDWLCGQTLSSKEMGVLGISRNMTTSKDAIRAFYNFLRLLKHAGIENVYLLIEEFEYVVTVYNSKQVDSIFYLFKDIYDKYGDKPHNMAKINFIIAITPGGWDFLVNMEKKAKGGGGIVPWMERMTPKLNQIELLALSENETEQLLLQRIEKNRTECDDLPHESWPFTSPEFFKIIYQKVKGNPRKSLKCCDYVFNCGIKDRVHAFDGKYTQKILDKIL